MPIRYAAHRPWRRHLAAVGAAAALTLTAACGSTASGPGTTTGPTASTGAPTTTSVAPVSVPEPTGTAADRQVLESISVAGGEDLKKAPTVTLAVKPVGVSTTTRRVLQPGNGQLSTTGSQVTVHMAVFKGSDGSLLDSTYEAAQPQTLAVGGADLVPGFRSALIGVQPGERLLAIIPPAEGIPAAGRAQLGLADTEHLVLVADVVSVVTPLAEAEGTPVTPPAGLPTVTFTSGTGPTITVPTGQAPPTELVSQLLVEGTGPEVKAGQSTLMHYTGVLWRDGSVFDSSWPRQQPLPVVIGTGSVIPGWDKGLVGKKVGSRVLLVIPPAEGYGAAGSPPKISGTDTLVFVVDILSAT